MTRPRRMINPLHVLGGHQVIGAALADVYLFPFAAHLYEASQGHATGATIRQITVYLSASHDAAMYYGNQSLLDFVITLSEDWINTAARSRDKGITDRVVLDAATLRGLRELYVRLDRYVPNMHRVAWATFMMAAAERWNAFAHKSDSFRTG